MSQRITFDDFSGEPLSATELKRMLAALKTCPGATDKLVERVKDLLSCEIARETCSDAIDAILAELDENRAPDGLYIIRKWTRLTGKGPPHYVCKPIGNMTHWEACQAIGCQGRENDPENKPKSPQEP